jgi:hypothetical protein
MPTYQFADIVKVKPLAETQRHDIGFAVILDEGAPTYGGDWRYVGLFINDPKKPTRFGIAKLYESEIVRKVGQFTTEEVMKYRIRAVGGYKADGVFLDEANYD